MTKLPNPPAAAADLARIPPGLRTLRTGETLWRIYKRGGRHPVLWNTFRAFGPLRTARFDHHLSGEDGSPSFQERRIYYAAAEITTCLAEFFQDTRTISRDNEEVSLVGFELRTDLTLLDLTGVWPTQAGASMALCSGPRSRSRPWSCAIYDAYSGVQGLYYPSSMHAHRPAVALYERALAALPPTPVFHRPLSDPALLSDLERVARHLGYRLV
ncbi:MAG TPA: RES family NAD+ phosphorylase [Thermoanaerobaculia bacterium]|nr:RES family NAD+ phosphorylase [Thermoanaerobaculia bacterium]